MTHTVTQPELCQVVQRARWLRVGEVALELTAEAWGRLSVPEREGRTLELSLRCGADEGTRRVSRVLDFHATIFAIVADVGLLEGTQLEVTGWRLLEPERPLTAMERHLAGVGQ